MMAVALVFRVPLLGESLWVDELHTAWVVADNVESIPERASMGNQSSLYFYGVWAWQQVAGQQEWSLRFPSLLSGILAVGLVTAVAHRWTKDAWAAIGIGLIASLDNDWIFFATEARTYAVVQSVAILQLLAAWHASQHDRPWAWAAVVCLSLINFYLHYSTILFTGGVGLALLSFAANRTIRWHLLIAGTILLIGIGLNVPHLLAIFERRANWAQFITATSSNEWRRWGTVLALLLPASVAVVASWLRRTASEATSRRRFFFVALIVLAPFAAAWLTTATGVAALFFGRYLFSVETCVLLLLASMVAMLPGRWTARGVVLLAVLIAVYLRMPLPWAPMRSENWPRIVNAASERIDTMDSTPEIVIAAGLIETDVLLNEEEISEAWEAFARLPIESIYRLPDAALKKFGLTYTRAGQPTPRYLAESDPQATVILLVRGGEAKANQVARRFAGAFPERGYQIEAPKPQAYAVQWRVLIPQPAAP
ncbi:hypothetical protein C5Y97_25565 [Blastopirellula marina]|uniref:Uncharacterized protein n=2 Tax=Blastopirellula marina TaxID=124 RepID=A0A2S8F7Z1_9BACT|nr:hypothetical protein C5Y98_25550 [Blastopirellula marina]PTL41805.1 hypothetical protein C5Y97_25565 [Blastopirellula marina]